LSLWEEDWVLNLSRETFLSFVSLGPELICSGSRKKKIAKARALVAHLAVEETGHSAADVARYLGIGRTNVLRSINRHREI